MDRALSVVNPQRLVYPSENSGYTYDEIFSGDNQAVIFVPEAKTRQWLYKKDVQATHTPTYYLDFAEYNEGQWEKLVEFFETIKA